MLDEELKLAIRERAYLEGDFVLRSGRRSSFYLDKYRFSTHPELLEAIGVRLAELVARQNRLLCGLPRPSWAPCRWRLLHHSSRDFRL